MNQTATSDGERLDDATIELHTDDERIWTASPVDATEDERTATRLSIAGEGLCELEEWR